VVGDYAHLRLRIEEQVAVISIDRPEAANALSAELVGEVHRALGDLAGVPRILVVTSATPGMFVAGADIAELVARGADDALASINADLFERIARWRWPTVAAIDGPALGGGLELALACDLRVSSPRSWFRQPELELGILAGAGANTRLADLVGLAWARRMLYLGVRVDAALARAIGLVDEVHDDPLGRALELAAELAARPMRALELTKLALAAIERPSTRRFDLAAQALLFESEEKRERMGAFLARRRARTGGAHGRDDEEGRHEP